MSSMSRKSGSVTDGRPGHHEDHKAVCRKCKNHNHAIRAEQVGARQRGRICDCSEGCFTMNVLLLSASCVSSSDREIKLSLGARQGSFADNLGETAEGSIIILRVAFNEAR